MSESPSQPEYAASIAWWAHQARWLADRSRFRIALKSRQSGFSTVFAAEATGEAVAGRTAILASASERQSFELARKARKLLPMVTAASGGQLEVTNESATGFELSHGGRVVSVPASAATIQGFTGSVWIDEAGWIMDFEGLWQALIPSITTSPSLRVSVASTPRGRSGLFYKLWHDADAKRWSRHRVTIHDAIAGGLRVDPAELRAALVDEATFRAAYECEFLDENYALLAYDLLQSRTDETLDYHVDVAKLAKCGGELYAGYDVARKRDLSIIAVIERTPAGVFRCAGFIELTGQPFGVQESVLDELLHLPNM